MCLGKTGERPATDMHIARVPLPTSDPVLGLKGGLISAWRAMPHAQADPLRLSGDATSEPIDTHKAD